MKVILLKDIDKIGRRGDVKRVADGYARNFLIPQKKVVLATQDELDRLEEFKEVEIEQAEQELVRSQEMASQLDGMEIEMMSKASEDDKLFGAINGKQIADKLNELGFKVEKNQVKLDEPIKEAGEYEINLELPHNLEAKIKLIVVADKKEKDKIKQKEEE